MNTFVLIEVWGGILYARIVMWMLMSPKLQRSKLISALMLFSSARLILMNGDWNAYRRFPVMLNDETDRWVIRNAIIDG